MSRVDPPVLLSKPSDATSLKQEMTSRAITKMVIIDLLPLRIVDSQGFRDLVCLLDPRHTVMTQDNLQQYVLPAYTLTVQEKIKTTLQTSPSCVLVLDIWRISLTQAYIGFTVYFISQTWQVEALVLACSYLIGYHSPQRILSIYEQVLSIYAIQDRVFHVVNNSAGGKPNNSFPGFNLEDDDDSEEVDDSEDLRELDDIQLSQQQSKGFGRALLLTIKDGLIALSPHTNVLNKAAQIINHLQKSTLAVGREFEIVSEKWKAGTKWSSQLQMIRSLLEMRSEDWMKNKEQLNLNETEKLILKEVVEILEPFEEANNFVHGDKFLSVSMCIPSYVGLKTHLSTTTTQYCSSLVATLSLSLDKHLKDVLHNSIYVCAAVLDPRFKLTWCKAESEMDTYKKIVLKDAEQFTPPHSHTSKAFDQPLTPSKLFSFLTTEPTKKITTPMQELESYLKDEHSGDNPVEFWRIRSSIYPVLSNLSRCVLTIPVTHTPLQDVFDYASKIIHTDPFHFLPEHLETLLFLKANSQLL